MPIFDFECDVCGHKENDKLVKNNKPFPCPECNDAHYDIELEPEPIGMMQPKISAPSRTSSRWGDTNSCKI